jgi:2,5-diketo-D-gluconate reductase B
VWLEWALGEFAALREPGKALTIGVSNFPKAQLRQAQDSFGDIAANQIEYHPYRSQRPLLDPMRERGLVLIGHSPHARGKRSVDLPNGPTWDAE